MKLNMGAELLLEIKHKRRQGSQVYNSQIFPVLHIDVLLLGDDFQRHFIGFCMLARTPARWHRDRGIDAGSPSSTLSTSPEGSPRSRDQATYLAACR